MGLKRMRMRVVALATAAMLPALTGCHDVTDAVLETIYLAFSIADVWA